jgi:hypothetical protein
MEMAITVAQSVAIRVYKVLRMHLQFRILWDQGKGMGVVLASVANKWGEGNLREKEAKEERVLIGMVHVEKDGKGCFVTCNFHHELRTCQQRII